MRAESCPGPQQAERPPAARTARQPREVAGVRLKLFAAASAAEEEGSVLEARSVRRLVAVDAHAADRVSRPAAHGEPDKRGGDEREEEVEHGRVVEADATVGDRLNR